MKADPELMRRVVANLIDNAAEAMEGAAIRRLRVSTRTESDGDAVDIEVSDSGHGISPEDKERLFLPHFSTKERGTGLGPGHCQPHHRRAQRHDSRRRQSAGRRAICDPLPRRGSRRRLQSQAKLRTLARIMPPSYSSLTTKSGIRESLGALLRDEGYEVEAVASGEECLAQLERAHVRSDPARRLAAQRWTASKRSNACRRSDGAPMVVMISGHGNIETAVRATKLGAFDFVEKPLSLEKIVLVVRTPSNTCAWKKKIAGCAPNSRSGTRFWAAACR